MDTTVAVIIPARNAALYVGEALESALTQKPQPHEVIVIDDRSDDDTRKVVGSFASRVRLLDGPGTGPSAARNIGILNSSSSLIAFLDADDIWLPGKLGRQLLCLRDTKAGLVYTDFYREESISNPGPCRLQEYNSIDNGDVFAALLRENFILTSSVIVRRDLLAQSGLFRSDLRLGEDCELWLRLSRFTTFSVVREPLVFKRCHNENITNSSHYAQLMVDFWTVTAREHANLGAEVKKHINARRASRTYEAARSYLSEGDFQRARLMFAQIPWHRDNAIHVAAWRLTSLLPSFLLRRLHAAYRVVFAPRH